MQLVKWVGLVALAAAACAGAEEAKPAPPAREVDVLRLGQTEVRDTGEYLGVLSSRQSVKVLPQVAGYVRRIHVRPGQRVEAGTSLLEIDARQESAALDSAQAQKQSAEAALELAVRTRQRSEALFRDGIIAAQELERARAEAEAAEAALRSLEAQVAQRKVQLQYFVVRAPFAGETGDVLVRLGDFVTASTVLTSIAEADVLEVAAAVPSERARSLSHGAPMELLNAEGEVLVQTTVFYVAPQADARTQLVEVKGVFRNAVGLRPSERVRVRVTYAARPELQIPALAVVRQSGQPFASVVREADGAAVIERRPIRLGRLGRGGYVVESGLSPGERIAVSSIQSLRDGMVIQPRPVDGQSTPVKAIGSGR